MSESIQLQVGPLLEASYDVLGDAINTITNKEELIRFEE